MKEPKRIYRIPPCPKFDIAGMESWLEDMAARGCILEKDSFLFDTATFLVSQPQAIRYRLEATGTNGGIFSKHYDPDWDAVTINHEMGWEYMGRRGQFHIYACTDPNAPEMHTDPRIQAISIKNLTKYLRGQLAYTIAMMLFYAFFYYGDMLLTATVYLGLGLTGVLVGFLLSFLVTDIADLVRMSLLRRTLQSGQPLNHRTDYSKKCAAYCIRRLLRLVVGIALIFALGFRVSGDVTGENERGLDEYGGDFPFATVEDLFPGAEVRQDEWYVDCHYTAWSVFIAPENLVYTEYTIITLDDGTQFNGYVYLFYHECRYDWFAEALAKEYTSQARGNVLEPRQITVLDVPGADYAVCYTEYFHHLILCKDGIVLKIQYNPKLDPYYTPEELAEVMLASL